MNFPISIGTASQTTGRLRLTRRGRFVFRTLPLILLSIVIAAAVTLGFFAGKQPAEASVDQDNVTVEEITIGYGDTLWEIAGRVNPDDSSRTTTIEQIAELNDGLKNSDLAVGEKLFVPVYSAQDA